MSPVHTFNVLTTLAAQRVVAMVTATARTVQYPVTVLNIPVGITLDTVDDTNQGIPVAGPGEIARLVFNDTVGAGELVTSNATGQGIAFALAQTSTAISAATTYLGVNVGAAVAVTGAISEVLIMPGVDRRTL